MPRTWATLATLIPASILIVGSDALASAEVCIKPDGKVHVISNMIYYGAMAQKNASGCSLEISRMFNSAGGSVVINGKRYPVAFDISYQVVSERDAFKSMSINERVTNNYVRIEAKAMNEPDGRSNHNLSLNCGFYSDADALGTSTTCAHEYAHGLGLLHYDERKGGSYVIKGQPGIMAARGTWVDGPYQWDPKARQGAAGGTINPAKRQVLAQDITDLGLEKLKFDSSGCAKLGRTQSYGYDSQGKVVGDANQLINSFEYFWDVVTGLTAPVHTCPK